MINFHIGAPRIGAELLHVVTAAPSLRTYPDLFVLPQASYRENFRTLVNTRGTIHSEEGLRSKAHKVIRSMTEYDITAISQHAALGTHTDLMSSQRGITRAATRVTALSSLFMDHPLTLHFMITNQVEYLNWTLRSGARAAIASGTNFSWSTLVGRLKAAAPERDFVVWDFERPRGVALAFVSEMLGTSDSQFLTEARYLIETNQSYKDFSNTQHNLGGLEDSLALIDEQYERDLDLIAKMKGVAVINSDAVPKNLQLSE